MPRPKKDGEHISLFLDKTMMTRLRAYAEERGQTLTMAMERIVKAKLDEEYPTERGATNEKMP